MKNILLLAVILNLSIGKAFETEERNCEYGEYFVPKQCETVRIDNDCFDHYYDLYSEITMQSGNFRCSKTVSSK